MNGDDGRSRYVWNHGHLQPDGQHTDPEFTRMT